MTLTTAEQALIEEVVRDQIVEFMDDADISRRIFRVVRKNEGDAIKIVKEAKWPAAAEVAEGAEVPIYQPEYKEFTEKYKKIGYRVQITHEMVTDSRWDLLGRAVEKAGLKLGLKMTIDVLREAWGEAGVQTFTISGRWGGANADEISDLGQMSGKIRTVNYMPNLAIVHPNDYAHLAVLDEFIHADKGGDMRVYETGRIIGLDVISHPMMSENNVLMLDTRHAGELYIREELRTLPYNDPIRDVQGIAFYLRYKEATISPSAICYATGY